MNDSTEVRDESVDGTKTRVGTGGAEGPAHLSGMNSQIDLVFLKGSPAIYHALPTIIPGMRDRFVYGEGFMAGIDFAAKAIGAAVRKGTRPPEMTTA